MPFWGTDLVPPELSINVKRRRRRLGVPLAVVFPTLAVVAALWPIGMALSLWLGILTGQEYNPHVSDISGAVEATVIIGGGSAVLLALVGLAWRYRWAAVIIIALVLLSTTLYFWGLTLVTIQSHDEQIHRLGDGKEGLGVNGPSIRSSES